MIIVVSSNHDLFWELQGCFVLVVCSSTSDSLLLDKDGDDGGSLRKFRRRWVRTGGGSCG